MNPPQHAGIRYSVSIDVPDLEAGIRFYCEGLGLTEVARPIATYATLACGEATIGIMQKKVGSKPAKGSEDTRRYQRHWTPVHIDFEVEEFETVLTRAVKAGAVCEQKFEVPGRPPIAFCSDPFGNGFCIVGAKTR